MVDSIEILNPSVDQHQMPDLLRSSEQAVRKRREATENLQRKISALVRSANQLPGRSGSGRFVLYNTFPAFNRFMKQQEARVRHLIQNTFTTAGCPDRVPRLGAPIDDYIERAIKANDSIGERAGILLDEFDRAGRGEKVIVPKVIVGADSTKRLAALTHVPLSTLTAANAKIDLAEKLRKAHEDRQSKLLAATRINANSIIRPQSIYKTILADNSYEPFVPKLRFKHHARQVKSNVMISDEGNVSESNWSSDVYTDNHPYRMELEHFEPPASQLESSDVFDCAELSEETLVYVQTVTQLCALRDKLNTVAEFAVDLEHNDFRSFLGITCLIQISTRDMDYIIDPFPIWDSLHILNEPFSNPKILKVFHGSDHDLQWLQRDFGIYVVNLFDTYWALQRLETGKFSLAFLVQTYCKVVLDKQYQIADWRMRPLNEAMRAYARCDTHYLLFCYDHLREALIEKGNETKNLLRAVYEDSRQLCMKAYSKPEFDPLGYEKILPSKKKLNGQQRFAMQKLWKWRDIIARKKDESANYVLPNHMLIQIADALPRDMNGIVACCQPVPVSVKEHLIELNSIIFEARDQPLEQLVPVQKMNTECKTSLIEKMIDEENRMSRIKSALRCSIDFTYKKYDEPISDILYEIKSSKINIPIKADFDTYIGIDSISSNRQESGCKTVETAEIYAEKVAEVVYKMDQMATPYECYMIALKVAEQKAMERNKTEEKKRSADEATGVKKTFTHLDAPVVRESGTTKTSFDTEITLMCDRQKEANEGSFELDEELLTKKALKRKRRHANKSADISLSSSIKRSNAVVHSSISDAECGPGPVEPPMNDVDYDQYDPHMFNQPSCSSGDFDPFNQRLRLERKKNFNQRRGRGQYHRMGNQSTRFKPKEDPKK